jgi:hypothetical protein
MKLKPYDGVSLSDAIRQNRLPEFIKQAEARLKELGATHPDAREVEAALKTAIRTQRSEGQT